VSNRIIICALCTDGQWRPKKVKDVSSLNVTTELFRNGIINHIVPKGFSNNFVDVRDVALAHVLALETPEAGGERIIVSNEPYSWHQFSTSPFSCVTVNWKMRLNALLIADALIQAGHKVTPYDQPEDTSITPAVLFDNSKSKKILGLKYNDSQQMAVDTYAELKKRFPESFP